MLPRPAQQPHPPIWVGGNSKRAIRRAVDLGDGWIPFPNAASAVARRRTPAMETLDDLKAGIAYARAYAEQVGRGAPLGVSFSLGGIEMPTASPNPSDAMIEAALVLAEAGVTEFSTATRRVDTRSEFIEEVTRLGSELVPRVAAIRAEAR
jgi:alkanesulfonate monooxygenase SsuD/methylene tetrahydromethanopterin reductase-like flavin-dependent oxidoreductase (luciferase family)